MESGLKSLQEEWIRLITHFEFEKAEEFYWKNVFPVIEKKFLSENKIKDEYDWLVLPSGLEVSYYVLLIEAIKPKKVYFLGTEEFRDFFLDRIIEKSGLKASDYLVRTVNYDEMNVSEVYEKIRNDLKLFENKKVVLDLTRGKRVLSVGAGIVGAFFGFDLVYIDEEWLDNIKRGLPGTEKLVAVRNPFDVFCDLDIREARDLFNNYNYGASVFLYRKIKEKISDPRKIEIEELLSETYLLWNSFNFKGAYQKLSLTFDKFKQYNVKPFPGLGKNLEALEILKNSNTENLFELNDSEWIHIVVDLYANALRKSETGMFEDAVGRLYRVLELIAQFRLSRYEIDTAAPKVDKYVKNYFDLSLKIYGEGFSIPSKLGLKDDYILLSAIGDYLVEGFSPLDLKKMFGVIGARDTSIIAHGINLVSVKVFKNMDELARDFIKLICSKEGYDFDEILHKHMFIKL